MLGGEFLPIESAGGVAVCSRGGSSASPSSYHAIHTGLAAVFDPPPADGVIITTLIQSNKWLLPSASGARPAPGCIDDACRPSMLSIVRNNLVPERARQARKLEPAAG